MSDQKIYQSILEWWHPNIDYHEMIEKFRWTESKMNQVLKNDFPREHLMLHEFCEMWTTNKKGDLVAGNQQFFQYWNKQFNEELIKIFQKMKPRLILDVCAGNGQLAKILSEAGLPVKAVDDMSWHLKPLLFDVECMDYNDALKKYQPDVVVGCWMNLGTDWTPDFRATESVQHYMIIGEVNACCGGDWKLKKGWTRKWQDQASEWALCRTDYKFSFDTPRDTYGMHHSQVVTYSRKVKNTA